MATNLEKPERTGEPPRKKRKRNDNDNENHNNHHNNNHNHNHNNNNLFQQLHESNQQAPKSWSTGISSIWHQITNQFTFTRNDTGMFHFLQIGAISQPYMFELTHFIHR